MVVAGLIGARATRLVTRDTILDPVRARITNKHVKKFVSCVWCVGWWIMLAAYAITWLAWPDRTGAPIEVIAWIAAACAANLAYGTVAGIAGWVTQTRDTAISVYAATHGVVEVDGDAGEGD